MKFVVGTRQSSYCMLKEVNRRHSNVSRAHNPSYLDWNLNYQTCVSSHPRKVYVRREKRLRLRHDFWHLLVFFPFLLPRNSCPAEKWKRSRICVKEGKFPPSLLHHYCVPVVLRHARSLAHLGILFHRYIYALFTINRNATAVVLRIVRQEEEEENNHALLCNYPPKSESDQISKGRCV